MSNEQKTEQKPKDNLTRIAVKHMWFPTDDYLDLTGITSGQLSNIPCGKVTPDGKPAENVSRWWTADFIPAWQMFEVTHHIAGGTETSFFLMPRSVKKWIKA